MWMIQQLNNNRGAVGWDLRSLWIQYPLQVSVVIAILVLGLVLLLRKAAKGSL